MKNWIRHQFRKKIRVYIFPTKLGGHLNGLIFLMFLLAIGYANNLLLIFTIFLFAFNLMWLIKSHFYLNKFRPGHISVMSGHAGTSLLVGIQLDSAPDGPWDWAIELEGDQGTFSFHELKAQASKLEGDIRPTRRGYYRWKYLKVKTHKPFGFYQVWIYFPMSVDSVVYPSLLSSASFPLNTQALSGEIPLDRKGPEDFRGLGRYDSDESRKISWKHYARTGELLIKEGEETRAATFEIHFDPPDEPAAKENYLSLLATQMIECHRRDIPFSFRAAEFSRPPSTELSHVQECLKVLALC